MLLVLLPFYFKKKSHIIIRAFLLFFICLLIKSLLFNITLNFPEVHGLSVLKLPYFVSVSRFLELLCCVTFAQVTYVFFKRASFEDMTGFLRKLVAVQVFYVGIFFCILFLICKLNIIRFELVFPIIYNTYGNYGYLLRLAGFYAEGGPMGLLFAFVYILFDHFMAGKTTRGIIGRLLLLVLVVVCAQSKAGMVLIVIWYLTKLSGIFLSSEKTRKLLIFVVPIAIVVFVVVFLKISENYVRSYNEVKAFSDATSESVDVNSQLGRISGAIIAPNMLQSHPILGIGLGNYPLLRNATEFRQVLPKAPPDVWDTHGLGGLVDIMVDGGAVFFIAFLYIMFLVYKRIKKHLLFFLPLVVCFLGPFVCGVQLHFLYPWFALGCIASFIEKYQHEHENDIADQDRRYR